MVPGLGIAVGEKLYSPGLDDFLFACVVAWAKNTYPDYAVSPGVIMLQSRATEEDKLRRQSFYAKQGFEFEWTDEAQRSGVYHKDKVGRLIGVYSSGLIAEFGGEAMLQTLIKQDEERRAMEQRLNKAESLNNAVHQALDKERHTTQMLMVILMLLLLIVLWAVL